MEAMDSSRAGIDRLQHEPAALMRTSSGYEGDYRLCVRSAGRS